MKKTKIYLLATTMMMASCYLSSCSNDVANDGSDTGQTTLLPGTTVNGAAGCTAEQQGIMQSMPGMSNIVSTTMDDKGNLIYSDKEGNKCTLDKEGNMSLVCTNGDTAYRDKTIRETEARSGSSLYGTVLAGTYRDDENEIHNSEMLSLTALLRTFPEAPIKQTTEDAITVSNTEKYDSISITFFNTSCYTSKVQITNTTAYDNVYTQYTATDDFFIHKDQKFHLVVNEGIAYINFVNEIGEESLASNRVQSTTRILTSSTYNSSKSSYEKSPTTSIYYNYTVNKDENIVMTNAIDQIILTKDGSDYETADRQHIKLYVLGGTKEEDKTIDAPPASTIK